MMHTLGSILFPLAGSVGLAVIITTTADHWEQARAALSALFHGGSKA